MTMTSPHRAGHGIRGRAVQAAATGITMTALLLGGCTTLGPDFMAPEASVTDKWMEAGGGEIKAEAVDYGDWWTLFNDPTLDSLVQRAYDQNLDLQVAGLRILQARAQLGIAVGLQYPQSQTVGGVATMNQISENGPNQANVDRFFYNYQTGFDASWELDVWGRFRRGVESAEANLISQVANYDNVLVTLTAEVARAYVNIRTFEERIRLAESNAQIQRRGLQLAQVRFRNGATTQLDVTQATTLLKNTEATIPSFRIGLRQSENALSTLLGMPPGDIQSLLTNNKGIPAAPSTIAVGMPSDLLRRRPDIRQAELNAAAQSAQIGVARADLFPQFTIFGSLGWQTSSANQGATFTNLFDSNSLTYQIGPGFSWPIFNYGRLKNNVRVQDAAYQQLVVNYQNAVLNAAREVEDGLTGFLETQKRVAFLRQAVSASQRSVDLSLIQYRDGAVDYQRVLDSQKDLVRDEDSLTASKGNIVLNLVSTYKALGGGWEIREGREFIPESLQEVMAQRTDWGSLLPAPPPPESLDPPPAAGDLPLFEKPDW